jgi:hypothetical protein
LLAPLGWRSKNTALDFTVPGRVPFTDLRRLWLRLTRVMDRRTYDISSQLTPDGRLESSARAIHGGLLALPLCGAAPAFFAAAKKAGKESRFTPPTLKRAPRAATVVVHLESVPSRIVRS